MGDINNMPPQLRPHCFKKGNKLGGRKKGKSLKEYAREYLANMSDDERIDYLNSINPEIVWKMSEGNPENKDVLDATLKTDLLTDEQLQRLIAKRKDTDS